MDPETALGGATPGVNSRSYIVFVWGLGGPKNKNKNKIQKYVCR